MIPALGGTARRLTEFGGKPVWSPDGSRIVFQSAGILDYSPTGLAITLPSSTLWMVDARGGAPTQLTQPGNPNGGHGAPTWSPDGKQIAFSSVSASLQEIWAIPANGGTPQRLVAGGVYDPVYGPGGRYLYFSKSFVGSQQQTPVALTFALMRVPLSPEGAVAGEPELAKDSGSVVYRGLRFSANGRFLVFSAVAANDNLQSIRVSPSTGDAVGDPVPFTHDTMLRKLDPLFSPDGAQIAYTVIQNGEDTGIGVWVADTDGKNAHPVGATPTDRHLIGWLPGQGGLTFQGEQKGHKVLDAIDLSTGTISVLRELAEDGASFRVSPDGRQIAFGKRGGGAVNVWVAPIGFGQAGDGPAKQLTFGKGLMSYPCWSPDGKTIAFEPRERDRHCPCCGRARDGAPGRRAATRHALGLGPRRRQDRLCQPSQWRYKPLLDLAQHAAAEAIDALHARQQLRALSRLVSPWRSDRLRVFRNHRQHLDDARQIVTRQQITSSVPHLRDAFAARVGFG